MHTETREFAAGLEPPTRRYQWKASEDTESEPRQRTAIAQPLRSSSPRCLGSCQDDSQSTAAYADAVTRRGTPGRAGRAGAGRTPAAAAVAVGTLSAVVSANAPGSCGLPRPLLLLVLQDEYSESCKARMTTSSGRHARRTRDDAVRAGASANHRVSARRMNCSSSSSRRLHRRLSPAVAAALSGAWRVSSIRSRFDRSDRCGESTTRRGARPGTANRLPARCKSTDTSGCRKPAT